MREAIVRLARLHALRCRMAETATVERERITQEVRFTEQAAQVLRADAARCLQSVEHDEKPWGERLACLQLSGELNRQLISRHARLLTAAEEAASLEREAVQVREQMSSMLQRRQAELKREQSRQEQARLDDLFATAQVRSAMATPF